MRPLILAAVLAASCVGAAGCASTQAAAAVGDSCLVGTWTLEHEENLSGYTYAGLALAVSGLAGARLTIKSDGTKQEAFDHSEPLIGTTADGRRLVITLTGAVSFKLHGDGHKYSETGPTVNVTTAATIDGSPIPDYHSNYTPAHGTYSCQGPSLKMTTSSGVQTETWSKG